MTTIRAQTTSIATTNQQILEELQLTRQTLNSLFLNVMTELQAITTELQTIRSTNESQLQQLLGLIENTGITAERTDQFLPQISSLLNLLIAVNRSCCSINIPYPPDLPVFPPQLPEPAPPSEICRRMRAVAYQLRDVFGVIIENAAGIGAVTASLLVYAVGAIGAPESFGLSLVAAGAAAAAITSALGSYAADQLVPSDDQLEQALQPALDARDQGWRAANEAFGPALESVMGLAGRAFRVFFVAMNGFRRAFDETIDLGDISQYANDPCDDDAWNLSDGFDARTTLNGFRTFATFAGWQYFGGGHLNATGGVAGLAIPNNVSQIQFRNDSGLAAEVWRYRDATQELVVDAIAPAQTLALDASVWEYAAISVTGYVELPSGAFAYQYVL